MLRCLRSLLGRRADDERGAVLVLVALAMSTLFAATAFAVDLGRVSQTARQEQAIADLVAIDAARALVDGATTEEIYPDVEAAARASAARNGYLLRDLDDLVVTVGRWMRDTRTFVAYSPVDAATRDLQPDAVDIRVSDRVKFLFDAGAAAPSRHAVAVHRLAGGCEGAGCVPVTIPCVGAGCTPTTTPPPAGCVGACPGAATSGLTIGSFLVRGAPSVPVLDTVVGALTGAPPGARITAVGYRGLADGTLTLDRLRTALRLGTIDELLDADLTVAEVLDAAAQALAADGTADARLAAADLTTLSRSVDRGLGPVRLGDLVEVATGAGSAAAVTSLPALPLVMGAILLADRTNLVDVDLAGALPGFATATLKLLVIEAPVTAVGPAERGSDGAWVTTARTSQVRGQLDLGVDVPPLGRVSIPVYFDGADAVGSLTRIACPVAGANRTGLRVDTSALRVAVGRAGTLADGLASVAPARLLSLFPVGAVEGSASASIPGSYGDPELTWDRAAGPDTPPQEASIGSSIPDASVGDTLLGTLTLSSALGSVPAPVRVALAPVLSTLDPVLEELVASLGLQIGGADVFGLVPQCVAPALVGP